MFNRLAELTDGEPIEPDHKKLSYVPTHRHPDLVVEDFYSCRREFSVQADILFERKLAKLYAKKAARGCP